MEAHLRKGLAELGLGDDAAPSLLRFGELLLEKNKVMNLTAITDPEDVASLHFLDSAALLTLADLKGKTVVDVGIHVNEEGKLCGDVRFDEAEPIVEAVTPVPGGVGTVTTSVLVGHVVDAASAQ